MNGLRLLERGQGSELLKKHCRRIGVPVEVVRELVQLEQANVGRGRRHNLFAQIDEIMGELVERTKGIEDVPAADPAA